MNPEDLTIEFAEKVFESCNMTPESGFYFDPGSNCGCLVGAMYCAARGVPESQIYPDELDDLVLQSMNEDYGIDETAMGWIIEGFDLGVDGSWSRTCKNPWQIAGYKIGLHFNQRMQDAT